MAFCQECGAKLNEGAKFCAECGAGVPQTYAEAPPVQEEYVPPVEGGYTPPAQEEYAPPVQEEYIPAGGAEYAAEERNEYIPPSPGGYAPATPGRPPRGGAGKPGRSGKGLIIFLAIAAVVVLAAVLLLAFGGGGGGGGKDSPYIGEWTCVGYSAYGLPMDVDMVGESELEFKANGRMSAEFMGESGTGKWEETEDGLKIISDGDELYCVFEDDTLILQYTGVSMYFVKGEGYGGSRVFDALKATDPPAVPSTAPTTTPTTAPADVDDIWLGTWTGSAYVLGGYGAYEGESGEEYDMEAVIDYESSTGKPFFECYMAGQDNAYLSMYIEMYEDRFEPDIGYEDAWVEDMYLTEEHEEYYVTYIYDGRLSVHVEYVSPDNPDDGYAAELVFDKD